MVKVNCFSSKLVLISLIVSSCHYAGATRPHIVFIVADDVGWNDVGFHGSNQIPTPNIDALAYNGIILNQHYVLPICTPSRAALLTGKYPIHTGMQGYPLSPPEAKSLPPSTLLPQYMKNLGYKTHLIGKWHLGMFRANDTPTYRGFDTHLGYLNGYHSYYDHLVEYTDNKTKVLYSGYDMVRGLKSAWDLSGKYSTDVFTNEALRLIQEHNKNEPLFLMITHLAGHTGTRVKPLEAPQQTVDGLRYIIHNGRRLYGAVLSELDRSVGHVVEALAKKGILDNTIIVFISDNGAPTVGEFPNYGSNWPLRGVKETLWEGGVRGSALIWSPLLQDTPRVSTDLFHITDWLPTLYTAAGGDINDIDPNVDGIDQWSSLAYNFPTPRNDILLNIDERYKTAGLRLNNWKLVIGSIPGFPDYDNYHGESGKVNAWKVTYNHTAITSSPVTLALRTAGLLIATENDYDLMREQATVVCLSDKDNKNPPTCNTQEEGAVCLYDLSSDPCEEHDVSQLFPYIVRRMKRALVDYRKGLVAQIRAPMEIELADPKNFNYTWKPWRGANVCVSEKCDS